MLGKTANGLFWMFRNLERSENTARLLDAGFRIALTRPSSEEDEWASILSTTGSKSLYDQCYQVYDAPEVIDFLLRDTANPSSVSSLIDSARSNARLVRTALTREVWEATNECWLTLKDILSRPVAERELPQVLAAIRQQSALVRGAMYGTMMRNDIYDFARLGTHIERADNTARILDVKYYVLLPSLSPIGSSLDNAQWETILRSVSAQRGYRWLNQGDVNQIGIAEFLIKDGRMPRSLTFCYTQIVENLKYLEEGYGVVCPSHEIAAATLGGLKSRAMSSIFESGLHEFIGEFISDIIRLGGQIEQDYRFNG